MPLKEGHLLVDLFIIFKKQTLNISESGEVMNYPLGLGISTPSHYRVTGLLPNSVAGEEGNCSGISQRPMETKTVSLNGCDRRKQDRSTLTHIYIFNRDKRGANSWYVRS